MPDVQLTGRIEIDVHRCPKCDDHDVESVMKDGAPVMQCQNCGVVVTMPFHRFVPTEMSLRPINVPTRKRYRKAVRMARRRGGAS